RSVLGHLLHALTGTDEVRTGVDGPAEEDRITRCWGLVDTLFGTTLACGYAKTPTAPVRSRPGAVPQRLCRRRAGPDRGGPQRLRDGRGALTDWARPAGAGSSGAPGRGALPAEHRGLR